jgi:D-alanine-D-alanine ligase-like ATP-grasp enzyme
VPAYSPLPPSIQRPGCKLVSVATVRSFGLPFDNAIQFAKLGGSESCSFFTGATLNPLNNFMSYFYEGPGGAANEVVTQARSDSTLTPVPGVGQFAWTDPLGGDMGGGCLTGSGVVFLVMVGAGTDETGTLAALRTLLGYACVHAPTDLGAGPAG